MRKPSPLQWLECVSWALLAVLFLGVGIVPASAEVPLDKKGRVKLQADFRLRYEADWDSRRSDGAKRADRDRLRIRARFGLTYQPVTKLTFGFRFRTGSFDSQQSPHITIVDFNDNPTGDKHVLLDKWYAKYSGKNVSAWGGRNSFPFWTQNELFWDEDVTPAGAAVEVRVPGKKTSLSLNGGFFALPDGGVSFGGQLGAGQAVLTVKAGEAKLTAAGGVFKFWGDARTKNLRNGNGARDYTLWVGSLQAQVRPHRIPLTLGLDVMHNGESYSRNDPDPFTAAHQNQKDGFVVSTTLGQLKQRGDWLAAYYYARIEALAVNASYAQDDWVRWGSATQTDSSDLKGHEFRLAYALSKSANLVARLYLVQAVTSAQDGKRFRLDFNYRF